MYFFKLMILGNSCLVNAIIFMMMMIMKINYQYHNDNPNHDVIMIIMMIAE